MRPQRTLRAVQGLFRDLTPHRDDQFGILGIVGLDDDRAVDMTRYDAVHVQAHVEAENLAAF